MSYLNFNNINKKYDNNDSYSVQDFTLEVNQGEFVAFVGPSGCGKTTTLRMIAGLEEITEGELVLEGTVINDLAPKDRDIAMVFQNYALYPHMTVAENITCGMQARKVDKDIIAEKLQWALEVLGLEAYANKRPKDLSGGQKQRVALGRAMVRSPKLFLMDEPLSNLDAKLRTTMRNEISSLHRQLDATTIYVTHDQIEAMTMADKIVVMKDGDIQQIGSPRELYNFPANKFVAGFIGAPQMNFFNVKVENNSFELAGQKIEIPEGIVKEKNLNGKEVTFGIRPEHLSDNNIEIQTYPNSVINIVVDNAEELGSEVIIHSNFANEKLQIKLPSRNAYNPGDELTFTINMNKSHFFDNETGNVL